MTSTNQHGTSHMGTNQHGIDEHGIGGHAAVDPGPNGTFPTHFEESGVDFSGDQSTAITEQTLAEMRQIATRYPQPRSALLPMLHLVQSVEGRVSPAGIEACAAVLGLSEADVSGVATFYTMYKRKPVGEYLVGVCTTALCAVMGGDEVLHRLEEHLDIGNEETTEDGLITLEHIECNAACDYAPVMMVNWEFFDDVTPESAVETVEALRASGAGGDEVRSTRGARVCSWRQAERVLAGFPDGRADEGPSAGPASLLGRIIADERGWSAPAPAVPEDPEDPEDPDQADGTSPSTSKEGNSP